MSKFGVEFRHDCILLCFGDCQLRRRLSEMIPFRNLLIMLDVSQVDSYLLANGWTRLQPVGAEIQTYRLPIEGTDDVCDVMIPTDRARHQFIDRLYKLVFQCELHRRSRAV